LLNVSRVKRRPIDWLPFTSFEQLQLLEWACAQVQSFPCSIIPQLHAARSEGEAEQGSKLLQPKKAKRRRIGYRENLIFINL